MSAGLTRSVPALAFVRHHAGRPDEQGQNGEASRKVGGGRAARDPSEILLLCRNMYTRTGCPQSLQPCGALAACSRDGPKWREMWPIVSRIQAMRSDRSAASSRVVRSEGHGRATPHARLHLQASFRSRSGAARLTFSQRDVMCISNRGRSGYRIVSLTRGRKHAGGHRTTSPYSSMIRAASPGLA